VLFTLDVTAALPTLATNTVFPAFRIDFRMTEWPLPPPKLEITFVNGQAVVFWPYNPAFDLLTTRNLTSGSWSYVPGPFPVLNGRYSLTNSASGSRKFFRLRP